MILRKLLFCSKILTPSKIEQMDTTSSFIRQNNNQKKCDLSVLSRAVVTVFTSSYQLGSVFDLQLGITLLSLFQLKVFSLQKHHFNLTEHWK